MSRKLLDPLQPFPYATYVSVDDVAHYGKLEVSERGSMVDVQPLPKPFVTFLYELGLDPALWNGRLGIRGMRYPEYEGVRMEANLPVDENLRQALKEKLQRLDLDAASSSSVRLLRGRLDAQAKMCNELDAVACDLRQQIGVYEKIIRDPNSTSSSSPSKQDAEQCLNECREDLKSTFEAQQRCSVKSSETLTQIRKKDCESIQKDAILERLFRPGWPNGLQDVSKHPTTLMLKEELLSTERRNKFFMYVRILRAYADAKKGIAYLYELESTLKRILDNLKEAMSALNAPYRASHAGHASSVSPSYRLSYAKSQRDAADEAFQNVIKYAMFTRIDEIAQEPDDSDWGTSSLTENHRSPVNYSTFAKRLSVLPKFNHLLVANALSKKESIVALYDHAGQAYKTVNRAYDFQESLVKRMHKDVQTAAARLGHVESSLRQTREELLALL